VTKDDLRRRCRETLAPSKLPSAIELRSELPKTLIGKVLRREVVRQHVSAA